MSENAIAEIVARYSNRVTTIAEIAAAAYRAGRIAQAEEDERIVARGGEDFWTDGARRHYRIACAAIRANAERLRADDEGDAK